MKYLAILFIFSIGLYSCTDEKVTQRLNDIKALQTQVDSSSTEFKTIDLTTILEYKEKGKEQMDFIEKHYHDTVNFDNAKYIDVYYANYKMMRKLDKNYNSIDSEITYTKSQLANLYLDVKNGLVSDSVYSKYYIGEKNATQKIIETVGTLKEWETKSVRRYRGMVQPIDSIINELQTQGYR